MRLVNVEYGLSLELNEIRAVILVIEEKVMRLKIVEDLYKQFSGEEGKFVLSEDDKVLKIQKIADILLNPFSIDCNNRKVLAKLYQEIQDCGNENFYSEKEKINADVLLLLDKIMLNTPYQITTALDMELADLCKLYHVQLERTGDTLLEQLMDYIKVMSQLCECKVFILLNFIVYLNDEERKHLYEFASYQKIYLLFIEYFEPVLVADEKSCIIDKDGCIIDIEKNNLQHLPDAKFGENPDEFEV